MSKRKRQYGPNARLPVAAAARDRGVTPRVIVDAMQEYTRSAGRAGLRHVEEETYETKCGELRHRRWTKREWLDEWERSLAEPVPTRVRRPEKQQIVGENGLVTIPTKDFLRSILR